MSRVQDPSVTPPRLLRSRERAAAGSLLLGAATGCGTSSHLAGVPPRTPDSLDGMGLWPRLSLIVALAVLAFMVSVVSSGCGTSSETSGDHLDAATGDTGTTPESGTGETSDAGSGSSDD